MTYDDFFQRYMGGCRRKHLPREATLVELTKNFLKPSRRGPLRPRKGACYGIPTESPLGLDFIRMDPWEIEYLYVLATGARTGILETGRSRGGSTFAMACANAQVPIRSIDIAPVDDGHLRALFAASGVGSNVETIIADSQRGDFPGIDAVDLLFIDGDHSFEGCTADLEQWYPRVVPGGHVLLHDCYACSDVQRAVIEFTELNAVDVIQSPYIGSSHWRSPAGSLAHFRKPRARRRARDRVRDPHPHLRQVPP